MASTDTSIQHAVSVTDRRAIEQDELEKMERGGTTLKGVMRGSALKGEMPGKKVPPNALK